MIETYLIIFNVISIIIGMIILFKLIVLSREMRNIRISHTSNNQTRRIMDEYEIDPFIDSVVEYAIEKGLVCSMRPGLNNKLTLYHRESDGNEYSVVELFKVKGDVDSYSYKEGYKELTSKIDNFIDNKEFIKQKVKEEMNANSK